MIFIRWRFAHWCVHANRASLMTPTIAHVAHCRRCSATRSPVLPMCQEACPGKRLRVDANVRTSSKPPAPRSSSSGASEQGRELWLGWPAGRTGGAAAFLSLSFGVCLKINQKHYEMVLQFDVFTLVFTLVFKNNRRHKQI